MKKILFNITRPHESGDEIANLWLSGDNDWADSLWEDPDGLVKFLHREVDDCCALLFDPSLLDEVLEDDAALEKKSVDSNGESNSSVQDVVENATAEDCLIAVLYHDTGTEHDRRKRKARLAMPEVDFHFAANYSTQNRGNYERFYKRVAQADQEHFEEHFEELWNHYAPDEDLEAKLDLLHKCLTPEGAKVALSEGAEILGLRLVRSVQKNEEETWTGSVKDVVSALAKAEESGEKEIEFDSCFDTYYQKALSVMRDTLLEEA